MDQAAEQRFVREPVLNSEAVRIQAARESIELSRERILRELQAAIHPRRQEQLGAALAFLDEQLRNLA